LVGVREGASGAARKRRGLNVPAPRFALRPLSIGEIFDRAVVVFVRTFPALLAISVPYAILGALNATGSLHAGPLEKLGYGAALSVADYAVFVACSTLCSDHIPGRPPQVVAAYRTVLRHFGGVTMLTFVAIVAAVVALIPAILGVAGGVIAIAGAVFWLCAWHIALLR
jgi:hypothetical protein